MSVFIKGMEKPIDCGDCYFYRWGYCHIKHARVECEDGVDDDCPLVSVTETHGDLIDANKLRKEQNIWIGEGIAPTVIEAEGE